MLPLDPHFIFNSLNHIQFFINKGEKADALSYVSRLSKFMRLFITLSNTQLSAVQEEILLVGRYLELEKIRFEEKFQYSITISRNVGAEATRIPSLMLYQFATIMIYHRVLNSLNSVIIKINFEYHPGHISFTWEDNIPQDGKGVYAELLNKWNEMYRNSITITQAALRVGDTTIGTRLEVRINTTAATMPEASNNTITDICST